MFGMGTGGTPPVLPPDREFMVRWFEDSWARGFLHLESRISNCVPASSVLSKPHNSCLTTFLLCHWIFESRSPKFKLSIKSRPRPISTGPLHASPHFHSRPIYLIIFQGSYQIESVGNLILRLVSHLDAFSAYPFQIWLPSCAPGGTTGTPVICPSRSSRTKDSSSQISYACDG